MNTFTSKRRDRGWVPPCYPLRAERAPLVLHVPVGAGHQSWSRRQPDPYRTTAPLCEPRPEPVVLDGTTPEQVSVYNVITTWAITVFAVLLVVVLVGAAVLR